MPKVSTEISALRVICLANQIKKFVEAHLCHFTPLDSLHDSITDTYDDSNLVADVDPDTLIRIVRTEQKKW